MANVILQSTSVFSATKKLLVGNKLKFNNIEIDNVLSITSNVTKTITEQPLELGANINDHSFLNPSQVTINISESKFKNVIEQINNVAQSFAEVSRQIISGDILSYDGSFYEETSASVKMQEIIATLQDLEIYFDLDTPNARFRNMTLRNININNSLESSGGFTATLDFIQLNIVDPTTTVSDIGAIINGGLKQKVDFLGETFGGLF